MPSPQSESLTFQVDLLARNYFDATDYEVMIANYWSLYQLIDAHGGTVEDSRGVTYRWNEFGLDVFPTPRDSYKNPPTSEELELARRGWVI